MLDYRFPKIHITERDIKLFDLLFQYKVATAKQILKYCYKGSSLNNVRYRLKRLCNVKLVQSLGHKQGNDLIFIYSLTGKGMRFIKERYAGYSKNLKLKSEVPDHDLVLLDIGQRLKRNEMLENYLTENLIQANPSFQDHKIFSHFVQIRSDAFVNFNFKTKQFRVAVEYENTTKSISRYEKLVSNYYLSSQVDLIFYFYKEKSIFKNICKIEEMNWKSNQKKFYFCSIENFHQDTNKITLENCIGNKIYL